MWSKAPNSGVIPMASIREGPVKTIATALAAIILSALFWSQPAEARCWWNGYRWHCSHYRHHYYHTRYYPYYYRPYYAYYRPAYCFPFWPFCAY
jgi:hypothetical protein